jgi:hypothetical protein
MGRIFEDTLVAVDGSFDQPQRWHPLYHDHDYARDGLSQVLAAEAMSFGRTTCEAFAQAWSQHPWATRLTDMTKYVFSTTLKDPA